MMSTILVVPYNENWEIEFDKIHNELLSAIDGLYLSIEHVGSTSVKGLHAKPIIDIDIVIEKGKLSPIISALEEIGYRYEGDLGVLGREAFKYDNKTHLMKHHLYVCEENSAELQRHILFRDYLRDNDDYRDRYGEIKLEMAKRYPYDIDAYIDGKGAIVREVYRKCGLGYQYIRQATPDDVRPAFELALCVFNEFEAPTYEPIAIDKFKSDCIENQNYINNYLSGNHLMYVALENEKIIGMINERGNGRISMLFVDGEYQRQGIAKSLMERMVCELKLRGINKITLQSSPYAVPFYKNFGFIQTSVEQKLNGFIITPMEYIPNEIWDVLDSSGDKTRRYVERGRMLPKGDYHLVVHVWKRNSKGEWLIDRRSLNRGTSLDGKWETTGGSAIVGDDSLTAALRETKEELGIELDPTKGTLFHRMKRHADNGWTWIQDSWVFEWDGKIEDICLQERETCDVMWATSEKIRTMIDSGEFLSEWFYPYFDEMAKKYKRSVD